MNELRNKKGFICDMDGVIYHGNKLLPGVKEFVDWLYRENKNFLFLKCVGDRTLHKLPVAGKQRLRNRRRRPHNGSARRRHHHERR